MRALRYRHQFKQKLSSQNLLLILHMHAMQMKNKIENNSMQLMAQI